LAAGRPLCEIEFVPQPVILAAQPLAVFFQLRLLALVRGPLALQLRPRPLQLTAESGDLGLQLGRALRHVSLCQRRDHSTSEISSSPGNQLLADLLSR
jgi:hypothetical protein